MHAPDLLDLSPGPSVRLHASTRRRDASLGRMTSWQLTKREPTLRSRISPCAAARPHGRMDAWAFRLPELRVLLGSLSPTDGRPLFEQSRSPNFPNSQVPKKSTSKAPSAQVPKLPSSRCQDRRGARPASSAPRTGRVGVLEYGCGRVVVVTAGEGYDTHAGRAGKSGLGWAYVTPRSRLESLVSRCHLRGGARGGRRGRGEVGVPGLDVSCRAAEVLSC